MGTGRRIVIVGAGGRLGAALLREYAGDLQVTGFNRAQLDLSEPKRIHSALDAVDFDVLINTAAQTNVDRCETERDEAFRLNAEAPRLLAKICEKKKAKLIHISTDYVFDGEKRAPYVEEDEARPISVYGESKREGEKLVLAVGERHCVVRVSWIFGPDRPSFIDWVLQRAQENERVEAVSDKISTPTYTIDVAKMLRPLFMEAATDRLLHLANSGECSWQEYGQWALDCAARRGIPLKAKRVDGVSLGDMKNFVARRPVYTVLSTGKYQRSTGQTPRDWHEAVADYVRARHG